MQIRPKKTLLTIFLLIYLAKYNKEINMTVKFLMITFKQSCVVMFPRFLKIFEDFLKNLYKHHFWLGGLLEKNFSHQTCFDANDKVPLKEASCKISTRSDNYYGSYAIF